MTIVRVRGVSFNNEVKFGLNDMALKSRLMVVSTDFDPTEEQKTSF